MGQPQRKSDFVWFNQVWVFRGLLRFWCIVLQDEAFINFNKLLKAGETLLRVIWCENNYGQTIHRPGQIQAAPQLLGHHCRAKTWYIDITCKPCRTPFTQIFFLNAFVKRSELAKQVTCLFMFMTVKKYRNFREVVEYQIINFRMLFNYKCFLVKMTIICRKFDFP